MKDLFLQEIMLNGMRRDKMRVAIIMTNCDVFAGTVRGFDAETIIIDSVDNDGNNKEQIMLYKCNVISVIVTKAILVEEKQHKRDVDILPQKEEIVYNDCPRGRGKTFDMKYYEDKITTISQVKDEN